MKEYLRRVAIWRRLLGNFDGDPFADLAGLIRPELKLPAGATKRLEALGTMFARPRILRGHLRWTLLRVQGGVPAGGAGPPFEPLIIAMERGNSISSEHGFALVDTGMLPLIKHRWADMEGAVPLPDLSWSHLDQMDVRK